MPSILVIDNHDSFVYNLVQLLREAEESCLFVVRLASDLQGDESRCYDALIISPGPGLPEEQPRMMQALAQFAEQAKPILGICLGCQAIALHYGYSLRQLVRPLHGHTSYLRHQGQGILHGLPEGVAIGRYHSWVVDLSLGPEVASGALVEEGYCEDIDGRHTMVLRHASLPIWGLQFHPESMISQEGAHYISMWLRLI